MNFGVDLEIEILLRLPLKSLMRFKCVQTSWNNLIESPYFVDKKTKLSTSRNRSLLIIENSELKLLPCEGGDNEKPIHVNSLFPNKLERIESYGSCNGVFCLKGIYADTKSHDDRMIIMWNPTTNEVHHIPRAPSHKKDFLYGFGAVDGDFKVVRVTSYRSVWTTLLCLCAEVYSLNTKSWTTIPCHYPHIDVTHYHPSRYSNAHGILSSRYNAHVNGVYYWITSSNLTINPNANILSFNFCNNQFRQLQSPFTFVLSSSYFDDLIEIKGSLGYVLQINSSNKWFEIWVMDHNHNMWSRKYTIQTLTTLNLCHFGNDAAEIFGGNAGELLELYDHRGNKLRQFQIKIPEGFAMHMSMCPTYDNFRIYEYVPSIIRLSK